MVTDRELGDLLNRPDEPAKIAHEIVHLAVRRGGPDNATAVVVFVDEP
jgi:protein phosphatase